MKTNYLKKILESKGIELMKPTQETLEKTLKMSNKRFGQIMKNINASEITVAERENLENWLWSLFQESIDIFQDPGNEIILKRKMIKS